MEELVGCAANLGCCTVVDGTDDRYIPFLGWIKGIGYLPFVGYLIFIGWTWGVGYLAFIGWTWGAGYLTFIGWTWGCLESGYTCKKTDYFTWTFLYKISSLIKIIKYKKII